LLRLDQTDRLWPLLEFSPDPSVRTYVIHFLRPFGADPQLLVRRFHEERGSARLAILLALGEFPADSLPDLARERFISELQYLFQDDPDSGIHSSVEWLLRRWGQESWLAQSEKKLISREPVAGRRWYVTPEGQTMAIVSGPVEFWMGSPGSEPERLAVEEDMHRERIPYTFAIATTEVTTKQFKRFLDANPKIRETMQRGFGEDRQPIGYADWREAVQYCRWLSEQEKIPEEQMCYPPLEKIKLGMQLLPDSAARTGYRLPTEKEWEYACRAGTVTSRSYGNGSEMLENYGWYLRNSDQHAWPVGQLKPNDFGLFDMHGNVAEWCEDLVPGAFSRLNKALTREPEKRAREVLENSWYAWRGGSFTQPTARVRSAAMFELNWGTRGSMIGLRVVRTVR
jgi:formylglycine-generating enzyme required for sulfatase activity